MGVSMTPGFAAATRPEGADGEGLWAEWPRKWEWFDRGSPRSVETPGSERRHTLMRFRPNGKNPTRRTLRFVVAVLVATILIAAAPPLTAQASATQLVPSVVGWSAANAATALHSHGFRYAFKAPAHHTVSKPSKWTVTAQSPKGKTHVVVGSKITLTVVKTSAYLAQGARTFYAEDYGTFSPISKSGTGTKTFTFPHGIASLIVKASHPGAGSFRVSELGKGGVSTGRVPVAVSGSYHGGVAIGLSKVKIRTTAIRVSGVGSWHITLIPVASARVISFPSSGTSDQVFLYSGPASIRTVSSPGPTTFMLNQISSGSFPNLAVNESGSWVGKIGLQPGPSVVEIHATGTWSVR